MMWPSFRCIHGARRSSSLVLILLFIPFVILVFHTLRLNQVSPPPPSGVMQHDPDPIGHPRLFANAAQWSDLPRRITLDDRYLYTWNTTIFTRAEAWLPKSLVPYEIDGGLEKSGVLDVARQVQLRVKHWAYAYRMSTEPDSQRERWKQRVWEELVNAAGNGTSLFGEQDDNWNSKHWLDVGEFLVAFAIAYDWLFDAWSVPERQAILFSIANLGLKHAATAYEQEAWFLKVRGNWNCKLCPFVPLTILQQDGQG